MTEKEGLTGNIEEEKSANPDTAGLFCDTAKARLCHMKVFVVPWLICPKPLILLRYKLRAGTTKTVSKSQGNDPTTPEGKPPGQSLDPKTWLPNSGRFVRAS